MPRCCVAVGCDSVGRKGCSLYKFPHDEAIRKKCIKAVKQQRSSWNGPSPDSLLCSKHFLNDCFLTQGACLPVFMMNWECQQQNILSLMQQYFPDQLIVYSLPVLV